MPRLNGMFVNSEYDDPRTSAEIDRENRRLEQEFASSWTAQRDRERHEYRRKHGSPYKDKFPEWEAKDREMEAEKERKNAEGAWVTWLVGIVVLISFIGGMGALCYSIVDHVWTEIESIYEE